MRQIRYRKKKNELAIKLQKDTAQLRNEVEELEQRRRTIITAAPTSKGVWEVAFQYFQVFRYGVPESLLRTPTDASSAQLNFLLSTMTDDVVFNLYNGVEAIIQIYKKQTYWLKNFQLELEGLVKSPSTALVASTATTFIITERTLHKAFPGVLKTNVANKLLGQRIICRGRTCFEWDTAVGRVSRVTTQSDLLTPMLRLLGNLEDTSLVFSEGLISPDFQLDA
ncbi:hypothetical protein PHMEG_00031967 [Phytophthora megakarya]|uniref:Bzip transcription factor n=1 Tax=Phytophthora megakarya TaxID=4795 RepID=A0A225UXE0_9STRA|nr:hypothetical protein PHMEG_00031967 [Phytophthora megakarya]